MVIEARRIENTAPNIEQDCAGCYVSAIDAALACVLRDVGPTLAPPRAFEIERVLGYFVDTMTGFALGAVASHLASGMRRWYGDDGVGALRSAMHGWPARVHVMTEGTIVEQLHVRFCHASKQVRALVGAVPDRPMTAVMLSLLAKEDTVQRRVGDALGLGWRVFTAAVTTKRYPRLDHTSVGQLWQAWIWALDGRPALTRDETEQAGYITLVR